MNLFEIFPDILVGGVVEHGAGYPLSVQKVAWLPQRIRWAGSDGHAE